MPDSLWERTEPLLPKVERRRRHPVRRRLEDREVLCGIMFVLHTGVRWEFLPMSWGRVGDTPPLAGSTENIFSASYSRRPYDLCREARGNGDL